MDVPVSSARWRFEITQLAEADLKRLDTNIRKRALAKIAWLRDHFNHIIPQPIAGPYQGFFKLRVGDWRIVYQIEAEQWLVTIHLIDRRDKIYKRL